jgi:hypothetical protein
MATLERTGASGHIAGFDVLIRGDAVIISTAKAIIAKRTVKGLAKFLAAAKAFKLGWARTEDFNIIYLYDKADDNFGYAVNLEAEDCSEWGYAPFGER